MLDKRAVGECTPEAALAHLAGCLAGTASIWSATTTEMVNTKPERVMPSRHPPFTVIPTIQIAPIDCPHCGGKAPVIRRSPDPGNPKGETRTFACSDCGKQTEIVVLD